jgi:hypothetical protein
MEGSLVAYKVFTNGSTLQASEVNQNLMQQAVATFSNSAARTAAITSPVEGQMTYLEDVNLYHHWNGSAWVSPFGLTLVKSQAVGAGVGTVVVADAFSADYDAYQIFWSGGNGSVANANISFFMGTSSANYYTAGVFGGSAGSGGLGNGGTPQSSVPVGELDANGARCSFRVIDPFAARHTVIATDGALNFTNFNMRLYGHLFPLNTSFTSFTLFPSAGTLSNGTVRVYGYRKN